jgi:hypothetical protein
VRYVPKEYNVCEFERMDNYDMYQIMIMLMIAINVLSILSIVKNLIISKTNEQSKKTDKLKRRFILS